MAAREDDRGVGTALGVLPGEAGAVGEDPLGVEAVARGRLLGKGEGDVEVRTRQAGAVRQAGTHPLEDTVGFAAHAGTVRDGDRTETADELGGLMRGEVLAEGLADGQAAGDGKVAHGLGLREGLQEEGVAGKRAVGDDAATAGGPVQPGLEFIGGDAVGPDVDRKVAFEPGGDERFELGRRRAVGEHERLAATLAAAGGIEEAEDVDLRLERRGGLGGGTRGEHDEAARIALGEADGFVETGLNAGR